MKCTPICSGPAPCFFLCVNYVTFGKQCRVYVGVECIPHALQEMDSPGKNMGGGSNYQQFNDYAYAASNKLIGWWLPPSASDCPPRLAILLFLLQGVIREPELDTIQQYIAIAEQCTSARAP